ncbi:YdcF family protein [Saccharomonospora iraqiensis]|uniref:YdcF family protein n=1 Tax=Saccharomonospora iraqiensis TaxID=52698 RepID=UPI0018EF7652|nr:YdcF family protein [Saccharomonospora iraqiensis]
MRGRALRWAGRAVLGVVLVGLLVVGGTAFRVWQVARADERPAADAIVVLGAAQYHGTPSEIFQARLDKARALHDSGVADVIVTSGGRGVGDTFTEAGAGADWLAERGVPEADLVPVEQGRDTLRSLRAVADEARARGWSDVVIVSDPWHSLRARIMAEDIGLRAATSPTHSGPVVQTRETQFRYILRETAALLYYRLSKEPADQADGLGVR